MVVSGFGCRGGLVLVLEKRSVCLLVEAAQEQWSPEEERAWVVIVQRGVPVRRFLLGNVEEIPVHAGF